MLIPKERAWSRIKQEWFYIQKKEPLTVDKALEIATYVGSLNSFKVTFTKEEVAQEVPAAIARFTRKARVTTERTRLAQLPLVIMSSSRNTPFKPSIPDEEHFSSPHYKDWQESLGYACKQ